MPKRTRDHHEWLLEQLLDPTIAAEYLNEAREDSQPSLLKALRNVAEARRMSVVAQDAGVNRESLYRSLSEDGNPRLETYDSVLDALGLDYVFRPKRVVQISGSPDSAATIRDASATHSEINLIGNVNSTELSGRTFGMATLSINKVIPTAGQSVEQIESVVASLPWAIIAKDQEDFSIAI
jgi:probable addiction module antidote protein